MSGHRLAFLVLIAALALHALAPLASAQLQVKIAEVEGSLSIETPFYKAKVNPELIGPGLVGYTIATPTPASITLNPAAPIPVFLVDLAGVEFNGTVPGYWSGGWKLVSYQILDDGSGVIKVESSENLTAKLGGVKLSAEIYFDPLTPYITYKVIVENQGAENVTLTSRLGGPAFYLIVDDGAGNWTVLTYTGDNYEFTSNYTGTDDNIVLVNSDTNPLYAAKLIVDGAVEYTAGAGHGPLDENATTGAFTAGILPPVVLQPGDKAEYTAQILIMGVGIVQLDRAGLLEVFINAFPALAEQFNTSLDFQAKIDELNTTVASLRDRLDSLRKANEELQKQLQEYQGCEDYWKQEVKVRDAKIQALEDRLQSAGMIQVAAFIIGLLLGVAGGRILSK